MPLAMSPDALVCPGPNALLLGRLAAMLGRREIAATHYADALAWSERLRWPPFIAQIELDWAELDRDAARAPRALAIARELGMRTVAARAEALLGAALPPATVADRSPSLTKNR